MGLQYESEGFSAGCLDKLDVMLQRCQIFVTRLREDGCWVQGATTVITLRTSAFRNLRKDKASNSEKPLQLNEKSEIDKR
jgi:hypothetical protein